MELIENVLTDNWQYLLQMTEYVLIKFIKIKSKHQSEKLYLIYTQVVCNFKNAKRPSMPADVVTCDHHRLASVWVGFCWVGIISLIIQETCFLRYLFF